MVISGTIVDVIRRKQFKGRLYIEGGVIADIQPDIDVNPVYILPGLIDSHVHVESSMLTPARFAQNAVRYGVVSTVSDPHEIANVCGVAGIEFMLENAQSTPFKFFFGVPSCVPATSFDFGGAIIEAPVIAQLFDKYKLKYLAEMMNYPGVVNQKSDVLAKLKVAIERELPIDGHAPQLTGEPLYNYVSAGIDTDHECSSLAEAEEKIIRGMKILIREGSAAKNFDELYPLIDMYPDNVMLCTDDYHPDSFESGYMNKFLIKGKELGLNFWNVLQALTINPIAHYKLDVGLVQKGDKADFIVVDNLTKFNVLQTWINGELVFDGVKPFTYISNQSSINNFCAKPISSLDLVVNYKQGQLNVIKAIDGSLLTEHLKLNPLVIDDICVQDIENDILKLVLVNRYEKNDKPQVAFVTGFGLKKGAIASSVAHDSHNIVAVGADDKDIEYAVNAVIELKGGIAASADGETFVLELPIAGLMTELPFEEVAIKYQKINDMVKLFGTQLSAPFMTLAFMSLIVIPKLKLGNKGLFDVDKFKFIDNFFT